MKRIILSLVLVMATALSFGSAAWAQSPLQCRVSKTFLTTSGTPDRQATLTIFKITLSGQVYSQVRTVYRTNANGVLLGADGNPGVLMPQGAVVWLYSNATGLSGLNENANTGNAYIVPTAATANLDDLLPYTKLLRTKGDLIVAQSGGVPARLAVGADGQTPIADSTQPTGIRWGNGAGSVLSVFGRTGAVTAQSGDYSVFYAAQAHSHAQSDVTGLVAALAAKEPSIVAGTMAQYWRGDKTWQALDKAAVGLANVDNTSDASKPISTAVQTALSAKANTSHNHALSDLAQSAATTGQVPQWNGSAWMAATVFAASNPTALVGLTAVNGVATTFMRSDAAPALDQSISPTLTGAWAFSKNGALSTPTVALTGNWITGGTATTTKPLVLIEPGGTTSTAWNTSGTGVGVNAASGFTGNLIDAQVAGSRMFSLSGVGTLTHSGLYSLATTQTGASGQINISSVNATIRPSTTNTATYALSNLAASVDTTSNPPQSLVGVNAALNHQATGTISSMRSFYSAPAVFGASSSSSTLTHFTAADVFTNSVGTVVTQYGFYIPSTFQNATNNWAFYNTSTAQSYFGGNLGINRSTIAAQLDVISSTASKSPARFKHAASASSELAQFLDSADVKRFVVNTPSATEQSTKLIGGKGESFQQGVIAESVTLSTGGATTDTTIDLPANSIIVAVSARVTAAITGSGITTLSLGDSGNATRFSNAGLALTVGSTVVGLSNSTQSTAAKVRITANGGTPSAGVVTISVTYIQLSPPTSCLDRCGSGAQWATNRIIFDGDSLTFGTGTIGGGSYPAQVAGLLGCGNPTNNFAVSGQTVAAMLADVSTQIVPLYDSSHCADVVVLLGGTNDLAFATGQATNVYNNIVSYCNAVKAAGFRVIVATLTPRSDAGVQVGFEADRQTVNTNLRTNWATFADGLADIAADPRIGDAGDELGLDYYAPDRVHYNNAGAAVVAFIVARALQA